MSGISILRNLLLKQAVKESGQASGIMSIGDSVRKLVDNRLQSYVLAASKQGVDIDKMSEAQIKYMLEMNKPYNKAKMALRKEQGIKSADVFDLKGRKLDKDKPIIGGTQQVENTTGSLTSVPKKEGLAGMEYQTKADMADARLINDMYRTTGPRSLDEDKMYLAEFIAEEAGKVLDDLPVSEQKVFIDRAEKALIKNVEKYKNVEPKSLDDEIKQAYDKAVKEGKLENVRLKDGRKIESEEDFRNYIDELNEDNNLATGGRAGFKEGLLTVSGVNPTFDMEKISAELRQIGRAHV